MKTTRLEAFSDGVFAILITILVLEIKIPHEANIEALLKLMPILVCYVITFFFIAIYWINHHHLIHCLKKVNSRIIWGNMVFLFPLSLMPFSTAWMGESNCDQLTATIYCINVMLCGVGAYVLQAAITHKLPPEDMIFAVIKRNVKKTIFSVVFNMAAVICSFYYPKLALLPNIIVLLVWVIPDKEMERLLEGNGNG